MIAVMRSVVCLCLLIGLYVVYFSKIFCLKRAVTKNDIENHLVIYVVVMFERQLCISYCTFLLRSAVSVHVNLAVCLVA